MQQEIQFFLTESVQASCELIYSKSLHFFTPQHQTAKRIADY